MDNFIGIVLNGIKTFATPKRLYTIAGLALSIVSTALGAKMQEIKIQDAVEKYMKEHNQ